MRQVWSKRSEAKRRRPNPRVLPLKLALEFQLEDSEASRLELVSEWEMKLPAPVLAPAPFGRDKASNRRQARPAELRQ